MDDFSLEFQLDGAGWARARVAVNGVAHEMLVSDLTPDPLGTLASALIAAAWQEGGTFFVKDRGGATITEEELRTKQFTWQDEPGGWRWLLTPAGDGMARLRINELKGRKSPDVRLVDAVCRLEQMAAACASCIERLAVHHGIVGYRQNWHSGDLPLAQLLLLRRWLKSPTVNPASADGGTWSEDMAELRRLGA